MSLNIVKDDKKYLSLYRSFEADLFIQKLYKLKPCFSLVAAYTATVQIPGVSGAGATPELRELTATADIEILAHGKAYCLKNGVPSNPNGAPGPSIITQAAFDLLPGLPYLPIDAGLKLAPKVSSLVRIEGAISAQDITTGKAMQSEERVKLLFEEGIRLGTELGKKCAAEGYYLIIGETVPGGTTTALGLLVALGIDAEERVSSSMPGNAHGPKLDAVKAGLAAVGRNKGDFANIPLAAVAALGDPMQPVVAGMSLAASQYCPVMLGGGTQMAAVIALAAAIMRKYKNDWPELEKVNPSNIALATTRWVAIDRTADLAGLAADIEKKLGVFQVSYMAANLDFSQSRYEGMQQYEKGFVKEGVGAGAAALAAMLALDITPGELLPYIERAYERLCLNQ